MNQSGQSTKAFLLSMMAGILIVVNAVLLGVAATWFPGLIPTLPGSSTNDSMGLYRIAAVGLTCGVLVLLGALLLRINSVHKKTWGVIIIVFSIPSVVTGGGFIIGFILGIIGGALALSKKSTLQET